MSADNNPGQVESDKAAEQAAGFMSYAYREAREAGLSVTAAIQMSLKAGEWLVEKGKVKPGGGLVVPLDDKG